MNKSQDIWWQQVRSDPAVLTLLKSNAAAPCHQLHYLQMITEKLAKAYFWRSGTPPPKNHTGFVHFLRSLGGDQQKYRQLIAGALEFESFGNLQNWIYAIGPLAYEIERLAPPLANDGPNPGYPWPHHAPTNSPAQSQFAVWDQLTRTGRGRQLMQVIWFAVDRFAVYAR